MKAIFLKEIEGKMTEINRREIAPCRDYYIPIRKPVEVMVKEDAYIHPTIAKEHWIMRSAPMSDNDFAVFTLLAIE